MTDMSAINQEKKVLLLLKPLTWWLRKWIMTRHVWEGVSDRTVKVLSMPRVKMGDKKGPSRK